jgi:multiple sugar transport system permease protein
VDDVNNPTRILYDDPRWIKAIQFQADMMNKWRVMPTQLDYAGENTNAVDLFVQGRLAMHLSGIWDSPNFRVITDFDWDVVQFPRSETGGRAWATGGSGYGITRDSRHPAEAFEFVKYIAGLPGESVLAANGRAQPALMSLAHSPIWNDNGKPLHKGETVNDAPRFAVYSPFTMAWPSAKQEIYSELDRVWAGDESAADAIAKSVPRAQRLLDDYRRRPNYPPLSWPWAFAAIGALVAVLVAIIMAAAKRELGPRPTRARKRETLAGYLAIAPWAVGFLVFTAGPLVVSIVMAFCQWDVIGPARWAGLDNFRTMAHGDPLLPVALVNTLFYTVFSVPLGVVGALAVAMLLNTGIRGLRGFRTLYYLPAVTSAVAASVLWKWIFNPDYGMLNAMVDRLHLLPLLHALGLTNPKTGQMMWLVDENMAKPSLILMSLWGVGAGMIIFLAGLQGVPQALYEAADIDGAGAISKFRNVTLPMLTPTIFFTLIMGVIGSFQVFTQALIMTDGGPHNSTLFYVLYLYRAAFQDLRMGYASALAWLLFVIILAVTLVQFRFSRWVYYEGGAPK